MDLDLRALGNLIDAELPRALFITVSGAHLYGFESVDSDIDLRGAFAAPIDDVLGLFRVNETRERELDLSGIEVELVAHEAAKYLRLMSRHNGYILEQVFSPLIVRGQSFLERLRPMARLFITRRCYQHYRGFLQSQLKLLARQETKKAKSLLYAYRVVLTGIHLLRTGEVEASLPRLNEDFGLSFIGELIDRKRSAEFGELSDLDWGFHRGELARWERELDRAHGLSILPEDVPLEELHRFLVQLRREELANGSR
jgi:uncharacterized protein